jgi:hypothetical protein
MNLNTKLMDERSFQPNPVPFKTLKSPSTSAPNRFLLNYIMLKI